jgi:two-component system sensor histidine kinase KdpD
MKSRAKWKTHGGVLLILAACTCLAELMRSHFDSAGLTMVYLLGVVFIAIAFGRGPAVVAAVLSVAIFDFAFVPPRFTFRVSDTQYLVVFAVMLAVAVITGTLTARLREQREAARQSERRTAALYRLTHDLAVRSGAREVYQAAVDRIAELFGVPVAISVAGDRNALMVVAGDASVIELRPDHAAAEWAYANGQPAGILSRIPADAQGIHMPLVAGARILGVLSLGRIEAASLDDPERWELLRALSSQTALAMERCRLAEEAERVRADAEAERTRSVLLSSVSHDLRTPLAAITGAASSLSSEGDSLPAAARRELSETISDEAARLNRLIGNLLDMTRVDSGTLRVRKEWHSIEEIVGAALTWLEAPLVGRAVRVSLPANLPLVPTDDVLLEAVVRNLVENAHKYSPTEAPIEITGMIEGAAFRLDVADRGAGLPPGEERRVFDKFYRGESSRAQPGAGLGLAISKGIVEAHGGLIEAANRSGGGAVFTLRLPLEGTPPPVEDEPLDSSDSRKPS